MSRQTSKPFLAGEWAECVTDIWSTCQRGDRVRVHECIRHCGRWYVRFFNPRYHNALSSYAADNFINLSRKEPLLLAQPQETDMPTFRNQETDMPTFRNQETDMPTFRNDVAAMAIRLESEGETFESAMDRMGSKMTAPTLYELQTRIRNRIRTNPEERWLILVPVQVAASASPPVSFVSI